MSASFWVDSGIDVMAYSPKTRGRWSFKDERHLIALAASRTPLEVVAIKFNRSVDSVCKKAAAMEISLPTLKRRPKIGLIPTLDKPRATIGLKAKGGKIAWIDVDRVSEPGEYDFRDGIIRIKRRDLEIWKKDPDAKFTLVRFISTTGAVQVYGLLPEQFALR